VLVFVAFTITDIILLFTQRDKLKSTRTLGKVFSLNDNNLVQITIKSDFPYTLSVKIIDEAPYQFQLRNFELSCKVESSNSKTLRYKLIPKERGLYKFGNINVFIASPLKLIQRRQIFDQKQSIPVYPSIVQMKQYQLHVNASVKQYQGLKKIQRIGHSYEFDHIKNYVIGEDPRSINWKASSRRNELMVNHYTDEKSQQVYCILNKSRLMNMPFNGLSLLDYSINTALTISNIVLSKADKIGLISFSDKIGSVVKANRSNNQLQKILNTLYNESESNLDPNYELLYSAVRFFIPSRSLIFLFTNFESLESLQRNLDLLRRINKFHLLVPIIFENTELDHFIEDNQIEHDIDIYYKVIARKMKNEKEVICNELRNHGIQYILTEPENLSINTINKYLELKSRGMI
jgi:uncharacterized protein (DUF58 family)